MARAMAHEPRLELSRVELRDVASPPLFPVTAYENLLMSTPRHLEFDATPSVLKAYSKMLIPRHGGDPDTLPAISATLRHHLPNYGDVRAYEEICGLPHKFGSQSQELPLIYPQVMAAPLHMQLLSHPDFPLHGAGLIHVRNTITRHLSLPLYERLDIVARLGESRHVEPGFEFDILTSVRDQDKQLLWEATTTILQKRSGDANKADASKKKKKRERVPFASSVAHPDVSTILRVPASQGRRYAAVCKDYNPIHLHPLTAKLFGFPRAIAHGMWVLGRSVAELTDLFPVDPGHDPCTLEVAFKRPVLLPSRILITARTLEQAHLDIAVTTTDGAIPHLSASLRGLTPP